jgi:hypothetical protein
MTDDFGIRLDGIRRKFQTPFDSARQQKAQEKHIPKSAGASSPVAPAF